MKFLNFLIIFCLALFANKILAQPLACNPTANPDTMCVGNESQLNANASGGSGIYTYLWTSDPPGFTSSEENPIVSPLETTTYILEVDDGYNVDTSFVDVIIYSQLTVQASPDFQLCQYGQVEIKVQSTNAGREFTTIWYFQGNPVGNDSIYNVLWSEYGMYAPNELTFTCVITDECGNTASDEVHGFFFPLVEITGLPLVCLYDVVKLVCCPAEAYQWYYDSYPGGTPIPGATEQILYITAITPGFQTICVSIVNDCGEMADTCFTFYVSDLVCDMTLNNSYDFNVCRGTEFMLQELNAYGGWQWYWFDYGTTHYATGQTISLELMDSGEHAVKVVAYNTNGCYDTLTRIVNVTDGPLPEAGENDTIPHGTNCVLYGSASGGSGDYSFSWEPADKLINPNAQNPMTDNLYENTIFRLTVIDNLPGCPGAAEDSVSVVLFGGPLGVDAIVDDSMICQGETTQLHALAIGGSLIYTYYWSSVPPGFASCQKDPFISPAITTSYTVEVSDGYNSTEAEVTVYVNQTPLVNLGPDISVCVDDTVLLDAGNPGSSYLWSTGSTEKTIIATTTSTTYDLQTISVTVTSPEGCTAIDTCSVVFDIAACAYDTLAYIGNEADTAYEHPSGANCGYISGNNCDLDKIKANYFTDESKTFNIEKVLIRFGIAKKTSLSEVPVKVGIWGKSTENSMPGDLIDFTTIPLSQIVQDVASGSHSIAVFTSPVAVPHDFYVGVFLPETAGDTVALMTNQDGESEAGIAWTLNASDEWIPYSSDPRFLLRVSNAIFPVVKQNNVGINEPAASDGEYLIYPNPAKNILYITSVSNNTASSQVLFYDLQGRMIMEDFFTSTSSLNLEEVDPGIYLLLIRQENKVENYKVIVY